jgi:hypothetical protein
MAAVSQACDSIEWATSIEYGGMRITLRASKEKWVASRPCCRGHVWPGEGFTLRRSWGGGRPGNCVACGSGRGDLWWLLFADWEASGFESGQKLGRLCPHEHQWKGLPVSLRNGRTAGGHCLECEHERIRSDQYKQTSRARKQSLKGVDSRSIRYKIQCNEARRRRRAKLRKAWTQDVSAAFITELFARFEGRCAYCRKKCKQEMDHFLPVYRGGTHVESNILPACKSCNCSKRDRDPEEWCRAQPWFTERRWRELLATMGKTPATAAQLTLI